MFESDQKTYTDTQKYHGSAPEIPCLLLSCCLDGSQTKTRQYHRHFHERLRIWFWNYCVKVLARELEVVQLAQMRSKDTIFLRLDAHTIDSHWLLAISVWDNCMNNIISLCESEHVLITLIVFTTYSGLFLTVRNTIFTLARLDIKIWRFEIPNLFWDEKHWTGVHGKQVKLTLQC